MNPKFKSENYTNLGGINSKFSPHLTSPMQFLDIKNFDFQTPGSLTQRWGSTQYMGQTMPGKIYALSEYQKLDGTSMVIVGATGGMWYGATTGNFQGISLGDVGASVNMDPGTLAVRGCVHGIAWTFAGVSSPNAFGLASNGMFYQGSSLNYLFYGGITSAVFNWNWSQEFAPAQFSSDYASIQYLVDQSFIANGNGFFKFNGSQITRVGLPVPTGATLTWQTVTSPGTTLIGFGNTGVAVFYISYVNNRGFESNIVPLAQIMGTANCTVMALGGAVGLGANYGSAIVQSTLSVNTPLAFGISAINVYSYVTNDFLNTFYYGVQPSAWNYLFTKLATYPASGSTLTHVPLGTTGGVTGWAGLAQNAGQLPSPYPNQYSVLGMTFGVRQNIQYSRQPSDVISIFGYPKPYVPAFYPRYLATFDNRLFCAGFSASPSTVWFSDVQEPEGFLPQNNFEVRTNDSDYITAMQSYQTRLYIFKRNSFHVLVGDNPNNFFIQEISPIYGCLNNRSVTIFENVMYFLDRKGVIEYTGAQISYASTSIQPIFDRMNYNAALTEACAAHDKLRNQVLFAIPIDGSSTNNIVLVYDYVAKAWTSHTGYNPSIFAEIQGYNSVRRLFCGDYSGRVNWFSASFLSDNGSGITLSFKTRYLHDMGDSVQKQFRRLYMNADTLGTTLANKINMYQDYGSSIVLGTTLLLGAFQDRIDYGISAKSLAFEMITLNTSNSPLKIHGFTIESRLQRKV